jgi:hypothetical protein
LLNFFYIFILIFSKIALGASRFDASKEQFMENISKKLNSYEKQVIKKRYQINPLSTIRTLNKVPNLMKHLGGGNQLEQVCPLAPEQKEEWKKLTCIKSKNLDFISTHMDRLSNQISRLSELKSLFENNSKLKKLPFSSWMPKELEIKIKDKKQQLDFYAKLMNTWLEDKNKQRIKDTGLFLNWDQADQYARLRELESNFNFNKLLLKKI